MKAPPRPFPKPGSRSARSTRPANSSTTDLTSLTCSPPLSSDNDADDVRRRQVFFLDLRARSGAVFRCQQPALLRQDHPAITPPIRQHAVVIDQIVTLPGGKDARMGFVE